MKYAWLMLILFCTNQWQISWSEDTIYDILFKLFDMNILSSLWNKTYTQMHIFIIYFFVNSRVFCWVNQIMIFRYSLHIKNLFYYYFFVPNCQLVLISKLINYCSTDPCLFSPFLVIKDCILFLIKWCFTLPDSVPVWLSTAPQEPLTHWYQVKQNIYNSSSIETFW